MRDCVFVSTQRVESGNMGDETGVIVVATALEKTEISKCLFSDCGTVEGKRGSPKKGATLVIRIGSGNIGNRKDVSFLQNVVVDSNVEWDGSGEEKRGGIVIWCAGPNQVTLDLKGNWFEETEVSGVVLERDKFGVPIIEQKRKI